MVSSFKFQVLLIFLFFFIYAILEATSVGAFFPLISEILSDQTNSQPYSGSILSFLNYLVMLIPIEEKIIAAGVFLFITVIISNLFGFFSESFSAWHRYKLLEIFKNKTYQKIIENNYRFYLESHRNIFLKMPHFCQLWDTRIQMFRHCIRH